MLLPQKVAKSLPNICHYRIYFLHLQKDRLHLSKLEFPGSKYIEGISLLGSDTFTLKHTFKAPEEIRKQKPK